MWAVYLCGPTECFLRAMFMTPQEADKWAKENMHPEGYLIKFWENIHNIDQSETGWYK